jgi:serine/threonine-protein kinase
MLGEFKLLRRLGKGGMATVWLAEQTSLHRQVALKLLRSDLMADQTYVKRFQTEAKAAAGLNHPNIVQVYVIGEADGQHFIAQEYVHGSTLKSFLRKRGAVDLQLGLHIMRQVASALQTAGEQGIVHRDIKPENIMLTKKGEAKVADFGLAQLTLGGEKLNLTQEGVTMGTPLYMSPEQVQGKKLDVRSDLYSFGVTCYHMFAGRPPFQGESAVAVAVQHLQDEPRPLREFRPDLPQPLCDLIHRMMAKRPEDRYPDAATVLEDVRKLIKALRETGRLDQVKLIDLEVEKRPRTFAARHPWATLTLLCLLAAAASAGIGWSLRMPDPRLAAAATEDFGVPRKPTAREQFLEAMFRPPSEDAWLAVIRYHDHTPGAEEWVARAHEQLFFLYLRDKTRWGDAKRELDALKAVTGAASPVYAAKARAGEFVLAVYRRDFDSAEIIFRSSRAEFERFGLIPGPGTGRPNGSSLNAPPSGWTRLILQARELMASEKQSRPGDE